MSKKKTEKEDEKIFLTPQDKTIKMIKQNTSLRNLIDEFKLELI